MERPKEVQQLLYCSRNAESIIKDYYDSRVKENTIFTKVLQIIPHTDPLQKGVFQVVCLYIDKYNEDYVVYVSLDILYLGGDIYTYDKVIQAKNIDSFPILLNDISPLQ